MQGAFFVIYISPKWTEVLRGVFPFVFAQGQTERPLLRTFTTQMILKSRKTLSLI